MELQTLANIAEVLGATTIVGGAAFALMQVREFRAQRRQAVAVEMVRTFQSAEMVRAINLVKELPAGLSADEIRARGPECEDAVLTIALTSETIAILVHDRLASYRMLRDLSGGMLVSTYHKVETWMRDVREQQSQPSWGEWYQWLVEQLERDSADKESNPAYLARRDWRPRD